MKKSVYLVQANAVYGEKIRTTYLPYATGCLAAYAWNDETVKEKYELGRFIFTREDIDSAIDSMGTPYLVGFSCYIWNMEYNCRFAQRLKERFPETVIFFGGHNVKPGGSELDKYPYVDILMHGEGEEPFRQLLVALSEGSELRNVNNISFRRDGKIITTDYFTPEDISAYPSPYLEGYFDEIVNNKEYSLSAIWETNRGCPNRCAFCDWGALRSRVRQFPDDRIKAELEWFVSNGIEYVYCSDANFGLFPRDSEIADMLIESNRKTGYPQMFKTNYAKNRDDVVFEISSKLISNRMGKSPTLSFQSLSSDVLKNIGRSNMELEHFKRLMVKYSEAGVPVYSELILGLPGETYNSFTDGMCTLLECNQHTCIGVYPCELLPNSLLGSDEYIEKFDIRAVKTGFTQYHVKSGSDDIPEFSQIVISTDSMSVDDWKKAFIFSVCVQAFHNLALTRAAAIYLFYEKGVPYKAFYEKLIEWMASYSDNTVIGSVYSRIKDATDAITRGEASFSLSYGDEEKLEWSFEEYMFIRISQALDEFYGEFSSFIAEFGIEDNISDELIRYQSAIIKKPEQTALDCGFEYDFYNYFRNIYTDNYEKLRTVKNRIEVEDRPYQSGDEFLRINVWYGRRDDAQLYTGKRNTVKQSFTE